MAETLTQTFLFVDKVQLLNIWLLKERGLPMRVGCLMEELWGLFTGGGGGGIQGGLSMGLYSILSKDAREIFLCTA